MLSQLPRWGKSYPLFKECLEALKVNLLSDEEAERLSTLFENMFPITRWGKIDWDKIDNKIVIGNNQDEIIPALTKLLVVPIDPLVYIEWSSAAYPVIQANLNDIPNHFNIVARVTFEKFIFNPSQGYIIEIRFDDTITVGVLTQS